MINIWKNKRNTKSKDCMKTPLVSIIILIYKNQDHLYSAIDSVFIQNYSTMELLISDDCSGNFSIEEVARYVNAKKPDSRFKKIDILVMSENLGTVRHANYIASLTNGKYIRFLGADDEFNNPSVISDSVSFMEDTKALVSTSLTSIIDPQSPGVVRVSPSPHAVRMINSLPPQELFGQLVIYGNVIGAPGTIFHRDFFTARGGFDETYRLTEDYPSWLKLLREGIRIPCMQSITVKYQANGISAKKNKNSLIAKQLFSELGIIFKNEVIPYKRYLTKFQYRFGVFVYNRIFFYDNLSFLKKCLFFINHADIIIWRRYNSLVKNLRGWGEK